MALVINGTPVSNPGTMVQQELAMHLQPTLEPTLTQDEMDLILYKNRIMDINGITPDLEGWIPTYDMVAAVIMGWQVKAAKVAGNYQFADETLELHREQVIANCLKMAQEWSKRCIRAVPIKNDLFTPAVFETQRAYDYGN